MERSNAMFTEYNSNGEPIAWLSAESDCTNPACRRAIREGRDVHIIPHPDDPRAAEFTLAMPEYHFEAEEDALAALEKAWTDAPFAYTADVRDACYAKGIPVKIAKGVRKP
jgi:hypothetical protein